MQSLTTAEFIAMCPVALQALVGQHVSVRLHEENTREGFIYTIDPSNNVLVLFDFEFPVLISGCYPVANVAEEVGRHTPGRVCHFLPVHAIIGIYFTGRTCSTDMQTALEHEFVSRLSGGVEEDTQLRKARIINVLKQHRIPVDDDDIKPNDGSILNGIHTPHVIRVLSGMVLLFPPYTSETCQSTNEIVLDRIRRLLLQEL